jgi:hypothetical protein
MAQWGAGPGTAIARLVAAADKLYDQLPGVGRRGPLQRGGRKRKRPDTPTEESASGEPQAARPAAHSGMLGTAQYQLGVSEGFSKGARMEDETHTEEATRKSHLRDVRLSL